MILSSRRKSRTRPSRLEPPWLPKSEVRVGPVKRALEFTVNTQGQQETLRMWSETKTHIICPREFLSPSEYPKYSFPFVDIRMEFEKIKFKDLVILETPNKRGFGQPSRSSTTASLNLGVGKGKTKLALKKIAQRGVPTPRHCSRWRNPGPVASFYLRLW